MDSGRVVVYFGKLGGRLLKHQRVMLMKDAETIARILAYGFDGEYSAERSFDGATFYRRKSGQPDAIAQSDLGAQFFLARSEVAHRSAAH